MLLLVASGGRTAAFLCRRTAAADPSRAAAAGRGGAARTEAAAISIRLRQRALASSASSTSASASSSPASSPLDAVSPDQALSHPTLASLDPGSLERNVKYLDLVLKADRDGLNMTAVRQRGPALLRHCADSLDLLPFIDREEKRWLLEQQQQQQGEEDEAVRNGSGKKSPRKPLFTVVDVGSGGGFPGAALAAARPAWKLVLIDALRKRCDAVSDAARRAGEKKRFRFPFFLFSSRASRLPRKEEAWNNERERERADANEGETRIKKSAGIGNAEVLWSRAEEAAAAAAAGVGDNSGAGERGTSSSPPSSLRESSPVVVARAVAELRTLAELCLPLVAPGGAWIAPKGPLGPGSQLELELEAARGAVALLGGEVERVAPLLPLVPGAPARSVVVVRKVGRTPAKYPRGNNLPGRRPL